MNKTSDYILDVIGYLIDKRLEKLKITKLFPSTVYKVNADNTYTIIKDKNEYNVKNGLGTVLSAGQSVWVMIPNGELRNMFVCGVR